MEANGLLYPQGYYTDMGKVGSDVLWTDCNALATSRLPLRILAKSDPLNFLEASLTHT